MGEAKRKKPGPMPSVDAVKRVADTLRTRFVVAGSRDTRRVLEPHADRLVNYTVIGGNLDPCRDRKAVVFVHGYNVTTSDALRSAGDFFKKIEEGLVRDAYDLNEYSFVLFTWPGDVGAIWFNTAQRFAHESGIGLFQLERDLRDVAGARKVSLVTHSLGAHVGLRSAAILGERCIRKGVAWQYDEVLLLAPAVENDVFRRPTIFEQYHFPESAFGMEYLHIFASRGDEVLQQAFAVSELDRALGYSGPESMKPLKSLSRRSGELFGGRRFRFELHDFSPRSATIMNRNLYVDGHSSYWKHQDQADYYVNLLHGNP